MDLMKVEFHRFENYLTGMCSTPLSYSGLQYGGKKLTFSHNLIFKNVLIVWTVVSITSIIK